MRDDFVIRTRDVFEILTTWKRQTTGVLEERARNLVKWLFRHDAMLLSIKEKAEL
jgi:hypothetical protein